MSIIATLVMFSNQMSSQEVISIDEIKPKMLESAIELGRDFNFNLDFSDNSIKDVENILNEIHEEYKKTKNEEGLRGIAIIFSFYIVAVIEKNHGKGKFEKDHESIGENSFPFFWNGKTIFPFGWCLKRIFDGEGDNIELKYRMLILNEK